MYLLVYSDMAHFQVLSGRGVLRAQAVDAALVQLHRALATKSAQTLHPRDGARAIKLNWSLLKNT